MRFDHQQVHLSRIDRKRQTYRITTSEGIPGLAASLERVGLINPPILFADDGAYGIVSGFRRVAAADHLGWHRMPTRILPVEATHFDRVQLAIVENSAQRPLNPIEISRALSLLSESIPRPGDGLERIAAHLGLPQSPNLIGKLKSLCRLQQSVQDGILSGTIPLQSALMLAELEEEAVRWFADTFQALKIGLNKQREIITLAREIALRDNQPLSAVLHDISIRTLLEDPDLDRVKKATALRRLLKQRRFPALTAANDAFEALLKSLHLGPDARLSPPPDFEGSTYSLTLSFSNPGGLERHRDTLERLLGSPNLFHSR
jgi:ParB family transcriptional regulator, chromosome partitioning protein